MAYEETGGRIVDTKYAIEFDNYSPSAIGDEFTDGDADVPSYESFEEGFQAIFDGFKKLFSATDSTKDEAKAKSVALNTTPTTTPVTSTSNVTIVALDKACQKNFADLGCHIPIQAGAPGADVNTGQSYQVLLREAARSSAPIPKKDWVNPDGPNPATTKATILFGAEAVKRSGKGETAAQEVAAAIVMTAAAIAQGRNLNASSIPNLVINAAGKIISRSQNVTQSTKHPKPERSYVSQQNAQQQKQAAAAVAMFASLVGGAGGKRITTPIAGAFSQFAAAGMAGSFQPDQGIVYEFPVEGPDGEYKYVLDEDLQKRYGTSPAT